MKKIGYSSLKRDYKTAKSIFKLIRKLSKHYFLLVITKVLLQIPIIPINLFIPALILDELLETQRKDFLIGLVILCAACNFIYSVIVNLLNKKIEIANIDLVMLLEQHLGEKIMGIDYEYLESPEILESKERAIYPIKELNAIGLMLKEFSSTIINLISLATIIAIIMMFNVRLILFLLIIECIKLRVVKISQKKRFELNEDLVPDNRKMNYYMSIIYEYVVAKDIRIFNLTGFILRKLESYNDIVYKKYRNTFRKLGNYSVFSGIITLFQKIVMYACMVSEVISNKISIGYFTMYVNAANTFSKSISGFWGSFIHFRQMLKYLENYIKFDNIPDNSNEQEVDIDFNEEFTIEFKHVYYKYPRSEAYALEDVNVKIQKGEVVAVVGENGAGKTTFIKLLCRLYQPEKGEILINNVNINEFSDEQYNKLIAVVFQDFKIYAFDIRENILFGQTALDEKVHEVLEDVGLDSKVQKLDKGLDTSLHKYFEKDGIELSGGEGQKLAIARAMYRNSPLVILDEPTAALDPYAESEIFTNTFKLMDKKTTIFVSHRLSSCKLTNHIVVFDNGRVIEEGTHDNLLQANKKYAQLWNAQAQYYN